MNAKFFLDTNVILYAFDQAAPQKAEVARQLIKDGIDAKQTVISYQVVQEFINVAIKSFRISLARADLELFLETALFPMAVVSPSQSLIMEALRLQSAFRLAWYDSLIVAAALESSCEVLYTEDIQHGQRIRDVLVQNPFV
jgi:predicted nucleic acid-binding protein